MGAENEWELIKRDRFAEAIRTIDQVYATTKNEAPLRNKVLALLLLHRYDEANRLSEWLISKTNGRSESDFILSGIALCLSGSLQGAIGCWEQAQRIKRYTDAAGGLMVPLLLYYGALRLNDAPLARKARARIVKRCGDRSAVNWPGPLGRFVIGELDERELFALVTPQPVLHERDMCRAHFWVGVSVSRDDSVRSLDLMRKAITFAPSAYVEYEYFLAKGEMLRASEHQENPR